MDINLLKKAFEVGVCEALKLLKDADATRLRQQLAGSGEQVLEAMKVAAEEAAKRGLRG